MQQGVEASVAWRSGASPLCPSLIAGHGKNTGPSRFLEPCLILADVQRIHEALFVLGAESLEHAAQAPRPDAA